MFMIFGSPRSGTTLLSETMNSHPDIFLPTETDFIVPAAFLINRIKDEKVGKRLLIDIIMHSRDSLSITSCLSREQVVAALDDATYDLYGILNAIYGALSSANQKTIAGDKSPNDLMFLQIFETVGLFKSEMKFIHIVRNVRNVCDSLKMVTWAPEDVVDYFPRIWSYSNCHLHQLLENKSNYLLVKYEDLTSDFEETIAKTCAFLGVPMAWRMLDPQIRGRRLGMQPHHRNLNKNVSDVSINRVRLNVGVHEIEKLIYKQASEGLSMFGYGED